MSDDLESFGRAFEAACSEVIVLARRMMPRLAACELDAAREFGATAAKIMAKSGATREESWEYVTRVLQAVLMEMQE